MSDAVERLRAQLVDAEEDRAQYGLDGDVELGFEHARELLALHDEAVRVIFNVAQAPCYSEVPQVDRDAVRAFLAKAGGK